MSKVNDIQKVASFDLYDTVVTRRFLSTRSLYESVWTSLRSQGHELPDRESFVKMRSQADLASKYHDAPTLAQILEHLGEDLRAQADDIEETETEIELNQLRVVPGGDCQVLKAREAGFQIIYVSDMHISATYLELKLRSLGLFQDGDILIVSSDTAVSKSRGGKLFSYVVNLLNLPAESITHYGNNEWSDVKMARKHGVNGLLSPTANPNRFESILVDESSKPTELEEVASLCRDVRLQFSQNGAKPISEIDSHTEALLGISTSVAAPVLVSFVTWVIKQCRAESISTIRFLTRDGELPYLISKSLPEQLTRGLNLGILEVSRTSLTLPAASVISLDDWLEAGLQTGAYLVQQFDKLPAEQLISRVGLSFEKHADLLNRYAISNPHAPLGHDGLLSWKQALQDPDVRHEIEIESEARHALTATYLRNNLSDKSGTRIALVDIGWTGQQAAMLSALIRNLGYNDPLHLHIGRLRKRPLVVPADIRSWLFDERVKLSPVENPVALFEAFCATTLGGVDGYAYQEDGTAVALRREQLHESHLVSWGQPMVRRCILRFAEVAGAVIHQVESEILTTVCAKLLKEFWENPTQEEAHKWGAFPYEQDQTGMAVSKLANPYNLAQLKSRFSGIYNGVDWKGASIVLSPTPIRQILSFREKFRR